MQVFIILKWSPDSIPRIQVSGVTSIVIRGIYWIHKTVFVCVIFSQQN
jgi:hypothetical protein